MPLLMLKNPLGEGLLYSVSGMDVQRMSPKFYKKKVLLLLNY